MRSILLHEGHHTYHAARAAIPNNDRDGDFLLATVNPIGPLGDSTVDSTNQRIVCDQTTESGTVYFDKQYKGEDFFDSAEHSDWASYAWEMTAWAFSMNH